MKKLTYLLILLALGLTACVDDESKGITTPLPELSIAGSDSETMPVYNVYYGNEVTIDPGVESSSENLTYTWGYGTYTEVTTGSFQKGDLTTISNEPVLHFAFPGEGSYYVHLTVTDGTVGDMMEYRVNVTNYYDKGILVVANSADGHGNLGFIKELTAEDIAAGETWHLEEHTLEAVNPDLEVGTLIGADRTNAASTPFTQTPILIVAQDDRCYYVNSTTFEVNSYSLYDEIFTGFRATHFLSADSYASYPFVYDKNMGESIHMQKAYWFVYSHAMDIYHYQYDDVITGYTWQSSINSKTLSPVYVDYSIPEIYDYNSMFGRFGTGDLLAGQNLLMVARETASSTLHLVTQSRENPLELTQYTLTSAYNEDWTGIDFVVPDGGKTTYTASTADGIPAQGTHMALAQDYQVAFYPVDNGLYAYYLLNASPRLPSTPLITYPAGEEITCLNVNVATNELYVGTYTEATGRGNVYIYSVANLTSGNLEPTHEFLQSTDRIVDIRYKN